jgi:lipopolysaccharide biosynthesis glycosyltransferase
MPKDNVTLVMSGTANYGFAIGNVIIGLQKHSPGFVDRVVIYHTGIPEQDQAALKKIHPSVECVFYAPKCLLELPETKSTKRFSIPSFAIYEMFRYLETSRYVLYLDADVLIQKDIRDMVDFANPVAVCPTGLTFSASFMDFPVNEVTKEQYEGSTYNTGIVMVSDELPSKERWADLCYEKTVEYWKHLRLPDQAILTLAGHINGIETPKLPSSYNWRSHWPDDNAYIIHTSESRKPWSNGIAYTFLPEWGKNNQQWISLGGDPYAGKVNHADATPQKMGKRFVYYLGCAINTLNG